MGINDKILKLEILNNNTIISLFNFDLTTIDEILLDNKRLFLEINLDKYFEIFSNDKKYHNKFLKFYKKKKLAEL